MAWYNNAKDLKKSVSTKNAAKAVGDVYSGAIKQPVIASYQAAKTGSIKPLQQQALGLGQRMGVIKAPIQKTIKQEQQQQDTRQEIAAQQAAAAANAGTGINAPSLKLFDVGALGKNLGTDTISGNEDIAAGKAGIASQFAQLGSLAKMREGAQRQTEQSAIQRRLAASGMGGSGAGMRLAGLSEQAAGRRAAETQLGIGAEQAGQERAAGEAAMGRNLSREQMRLGAAESAAERGFRAQQANVLQEQFNAQFEQDKAVTLENQKIAREISRYNQSGLIGQLGQDIFGSLGRKTTMANPLGGIRG